MNSTTHGISSKTNFLAKLGAIEATESSCICPKGYQMASSSSQSPRHAKPFQMPLHLHYRVVFPTYIGNTLSPLDAVAPVYLKLKEDLQPPTLASQLHMQSCNSPLCSTEYTNPTLSRSWLPRGRRIIALCNGRGYICIIQTLSETVLRLMLLFVWFVGW